MSTHTIRQLKQREFWTDAEGVAHRLDEMDAGHRGNLLRWLQRNATAIAGDQIRAHARWGTVDRDRALNALTPERAEQWLARQPLVRRLVELRQADIQRSRIQVRVRATKPSPGLDITPEGWATLDARQRQAIEFIATRQTDLGPAAGSPAAIAAEEHRLGHLLITGSSSDDFDRWLRFGFPWETKAVRDDPATTDGVHGANAHGDPVVLHDGEPKEEWRSAQEALDAAADRYEKATGEPVQITYPPGQAGRMHGTRGPWAELSHARREIADLRAQRDGILRDIKQVREDLRASRTALANERQAGLAKQLRIDRLERELTVLRDRAQRPSPMPGGTYHAHVLLPGEAEAPGGSAGAGFYFQVGEAFSWEDPRTRIRVSGAPTNAKAFDQAAEHMVRRPTSSDELDAILWEGYTPPGSDNYGSL